MSYILQGSGALLGPCISQIVAKDVSRLAPCICLKCSRLVSPVPERGKTPQFRMISQHSNSSSHHHHQVSPGVSPVIRDLSPSPGGDYRLRYPGPVFSERHITSYTVPGTSSRSPLSVQLTFTVAPDLSSGVSYRLLHTSPLLDKKASSKIEETVIRLKEKQDEALADISKVQDLEKKIANVIEEEDMVSDIIIYP